MFWIQCRHIENVRIRQIVLFFSLHFIRYIAQSQWCQYLHFVNRFT